MDDEPKNEDLAYLAIGLLIFLFLVEVLPRVMGVVP